MNLKIKSKRNFFELSFLLFFSLLTLDFNKNTLNNFKKKGIRFIKKNKKVWILSQNDFE